MMSHSSAVVRLELRDCVPVQAENWRNVGYKLERVQEGTPGMIRDSQNKAYGGRLSIFLVSRD